MAGQAARDDEHGVDTHFVAVSRVSRRQALRGNRNATEPILVERPIGGLRGAALLDLDECQNAAAPCDQVDFTAGNTSAPRENAPAPQAEPPGGDRFRLAAARLGQLAAQRSPPISSARA